MAKDWDYAALSHTAKEAGGPEKYLEIIKNHSFNDGRKQQAIIDGVILLGAVAAFIGSRIYLKVMNREVTDKKADDAEKELISKMNETLAQEQDEENEKTEEEGENNA